MKTAFLYADIEEDVYIKVAPSFETTNKDGIQLVMKLQKSLYGLAQSPRNWWQTNDPKLIELVWFHVTEKKILRQHVQS